MEKRGLIFWFTGLSGSGKTTVAMGVKHLLEEKGFTTLILDGDDIREKLHIDLGFSEEDIKKNNRLIADMCGSKRKEYDVIMVPVISPFDSSRKDARSLLGKGFYEIYFAASVEVVITRDVKKLYHKAKKGEITNLIGYSPGAIYEVPKTPDLVLDSEQESVEKSVDKFYNFTIERINEYLYE